MRTIAYLLLPALAVGCAGQTKPLTEPPPAVAEPARPPEKGEPAQRPSTAPPPRAPSSAAAPAPAHAAPAPAHAAPAPAHAAPAPAHAAPAPSPVPLAPAAVPAPPAPVAKAEVAAHLDIKGLEQRLRSTSAIGVFTKLSLKNQVDDLLAKFRIYHGGQQPPTLVDLRPNYELLIMKVQSLIQRDDPTLADDVARSRETIWGVLADKTRFETI
jgi:hypothetical protein